MIENETVILSRLYTAIYYQMKTQIPTPGGPHIYSSGATEKDFQSSKFPNISFNQAYSSYMLGFDKNGAYKGESAARIPKKKHKGDHPDALEKYNFGIIERTTIEAAKIVAIPTGGKVVNDLYGSI